MSEIKNLSLQKLVVTTTTPITTTIVTTTPTPTMTLVTTTTPTPTTTLATKTTITTTPIVKETQETQNQEKSATLNIKL